MSSSPFPLDPGASATGTATAGGGAGAGTGAGGGVCIGGGIAAAAEDIGICGHGACALQLGEHQRLILENDKPLDDVLELTDVTRPAVLEERVAQRVRRLSKWAAVPL